MSGDGYFTRACSEILESVLDAEKVLLTTSCTSALDLSAILLNIVKGDEVIVPSFTFVSTANSFASHGAKIVFADIREDTLNINESKLENLITPRTKAIVPVHYAGVGCAMDPIISLAEKHNIKVIEDSAHGLMGFYKGASLGTIGDLATLSFHETKNFVCGEGGALIINDSNLIERAEIIREKGTNRTSFFRGQTNKYTWVDFGSSFLPSEILAAFLLGQLEKRHQIQQRRKQIWDRYYQGLKQWADQNDIRMPFVPEYCKQAYHMFYLILPNENLRNGIIDHLRTKGILAVFHYLPLHKSNFAKTLSKKEYNCPVSDSVSSRLVRLPFYFSLSEYDQDYVITSIKEYLS